ncbi:MAG: acyl-CoA dehydrogenase [Micromonosporaceae bacterium]|nr:acyl-CoA dehydrogenase [Micromonosporaceae bacterium]
MDLTLTGDQELIQDTAREVLAARRGSADARAVADDPAGYSTGLWKEMVELGWTGLAFPESHGGVGLGFLELCLLVEELGRAGTPSPFLSTVVCCGMPVARFGTERQKAEWLGAVVRGRVMSHARAAPGGRWGAAGSDVAAAAGGDGFTLDGTALFVPYAHVAEDLLVVAQAGGAEELTALLVAAASPGIAVEPLEVVGADRLCRVRFDGVTVPADRVLGEPGAGQAVADAIDAYGAAATCAELVGGAQGVLDMTVEYAGQRQQFGRPIGAFQAVQHHCADMAVDVLGSRLVAYEAIWRLSAGLDATMEVSAAKAWVSEACQRVCALGHQVHGAIGFTAEHDLRFFYQHATASALAFGDGDFHTERVARRLGL